jgi:hypothetical protein
MLQTERPNLTVAEVDALHKCSGIRLKRWLQGDDLRAVARPRFSKAG